MVDVLADGLGAGLRQGGSRRGRASAGADEKQRRVGANGAKARRNGSGEYCIYIAESRAVPHLGGGDAAVLEHICHEAADEGLALVSGPPEPGALLAMAHGEDGGSVANLLKGAH